MCIPRISSGDPITTTSPGGAFEVAPGAPESSQEAKLELGKSWNVQLIRATPNDGFGVGGDGREMFEVQQEPEIGTDFAFSISLETSSDMDSDILFPLLWLPMEAGFAW